MKGFSKVMVLVLMLALAAGSCVAQESYKVFHKYLVDLKGWDGEDPAGMAMDMPGMKMITATREYEKGDQTLMATVMIGGASVMAMKMGEISVETNDGSVKSKKIDGFQTVVSEDKDDDSAVIIVHLCKNDASAAIFMLVGEECKADDLVELAKKFDWKAMAKDAKKKL